MKKLRQTVACVMLSWLLAGGVGPTRGLLMAQARLNKEGMHEQMRQLAVAMRVLKGQIGESERVNGATDTALRAQLDSLQQQLNQISAQMGGDLPSPGDLGVQALAADAGPGVRVAPAAPPGCVSTLTTFTQSTPVAIPTGPAVVTSTLVVSGAGPYLLDVDLTTFITHTFNADLDITLTSPAGTVVTITTDNGGSNDNVFNGTVWDDSANPGGQVPYTTNNGLVTDHLYSNLVVATPLVPEEHLAAFIGENPNGTWTLTISDDLAGDGGNLASWSLNTTTLPAAPITTLNNYTQSTPVAIPTGPAVVTSTLVVAGAPAYLSDVNLTTFLTHTFAADLDITLMSPAGTVVTITTDNGGSNDNVFNGTVWDDSANPGGQVPYTTNNGLVTDHAYVNLTTATPLVPEEALGAFIGENPNGTWTLTISDDLAADGGSLNSWSLAITTANCGGCSLTCPANVTASNTVNQCGAVTNYAAPTTTGTCGTVTCAPASGSFFAVGTTTVTCTATGASCNFTVRINDTQPPALTAPPNLAPACEAPALIQTSQLGTATASDNCPGVSSITRTGVPNGNVYQDGTTVITYSVSDAAGNLTQRTQNVTLTPNHRTHGHLHSVVPPTHTGENHQHHGQHGHTVQANSCPPHVPGHSPSAVEEAPEEGLFSARPR